MSIESRIDELIKAGWGVLESDFDPVAFQHWRRKAFDCLNTMFGPDHIYTKYFEHFVQQGDRTNVSGCRRRPRGCQTTNGEQRIWLNKTDEALTLRSVLPLTGSAGVFLKR